MAPIISKTENKLYNRFANIDISSPKKYLQNAYGRVVHYYTDEEISEQERRKRIYKTSAVAATVISTLAIIGALRKGKVGIDNVNSVKNKSKFNPLNYISNAISNIINIKDDYWDKFTRSDKLKKIPGFNALEKVGDWITNLYKTTVKSSLKGKYSEVYNNVIKAGGENIANLQNYDDFFAEVNKVTYAGLHQKGNRVTDKLFNKSFFSRFFKGSIADKKIAEAFPEKLPLVQIDEKWSDGLKSAVEKFNSQREKTFNILSPKMRDINCGSAPTDLLTILISMIGLTTSAAHAPSKEERKSVYTNLGIPLMVTLLSTMFGTMKAYSGAKSLIFGLATGQVASKAAKLIDKSISKDKTDTNN